MKQPGDIAPPFTLKDQHGQTHSLEDYRGKWLVLYFYPKDMTPGCTVEACNFRDHHPILERQAAVVGVSTDTEESHQKFAAKHTLPFTLLADSDKQMVQAYEVYGKKKFMGREFTGTHRVTYLINPEGIIHKVYTKVNPAIHVHEILNDLQNV